MDELTKPELETLRLLLVGRREELALQLDKSAAGAKPVDLEEPIGRLSRMEAIQQQHMTQATRRAQETELSAIRQALLEMESDEYGDCRHCEEPIGFARLQARPHAKVCMPCQSRLETASQRS